MHTCNFRLKEQAKSFEPHYNLCKFAHLYKLNSLLLLMHIICMLNYLYKMFISKNIFLRLEWEKNFQIDCIWRKTFNLNIRCSQLDSLNKVCMWYCLKKLLSCIRCKSKHFLYNLCKDYCNHCIDCSMMYRIAKLSKVHIMLGNIMIRIYSKYI